MDDIVNGPNLTDMKAMNKCNCQMKRYLCIKSIVNKVQTLHLLKCKHKFNA